MEGARTGNKTGSCRFLAACLLLLSCLAVPVPGAALTALPDLGIDYETMKVTQAAKLSAAGVTNVRNGDPVSMQPDPREGKIRFKNLRTGDEWVYPPEGKQGKER